MSELKYMTHKNIYKLAVQMLTETNPYICDLEELAYVNYESDYATEYNLLKILDDVIRDHKESISAETNEIENHTSCLNCISEALYRYYENFNSFSYAHKNLVKRQLFNWQETIKTTFNIENADTIPELQPGRDDLDKGIAIIKKLHDPKGVTVKDISATLNVTERAVQKELKTLEGKSIDKKPYCIGGQPVKIKINKNDSVRPPIYKTVNTVHPIVLQANVMQAANILEALADSYIEHERIVSIVTGIDIWAQLSDYAREKIEIYFAIFNPNLMNFIKEIESVVPNESTLLKFSTERKMINEWGSSDQEKLLFYLKGKNRICNIKLKHSEDMLLRQRIDVVTDESQQIIIIASDESGNSIRINYNEIEYVE